MPMPSQDMITTVTSATLLALTYYAYPYGFITGFITACIGAVGLWRTVTKAQTANEALALAFYSMFGFIGLEAFITLISIFSYSLIDAFSSFAWLGLKGAFFFILFFLEVDTTQTY